MNATKSLKWHRLAPGLYAATGREGTRYEVERLGHCDYDRRRGERERWLLRVDGEVADAGDTAREAKGYAEMAEASQQWGTNGQE